MADLQNSIHLHEDDLELYIRGRLEPRHTSTLESHLLGCEECQERFSQSLGLRQAYHPIGRQNHRSEPRFSAGDEAVLQELHPLCVDRWKVKIVDVSRNGLGLVAPKAIMPGTLVRVRIKDSVELGEVRHCQERAPNEYRIGLRLTSHG